MIAIDSQYDKANQKPQEQTYAPIDFKSFQFSLHADGLIEGKKKEILDIQTYM